MEHYGFKLVDKWQGTVRAIKIKNTLFKVFIDMDSDSYYFKDVTLLVTHYNRSSSLERLLETFQAQKFRFEDIVVSDDNSKPEHLENLRKLENKYTFRLITSPVNKGLGNNLNKGQDAVKTNYVLYVQEDFVPKPAFFTAFKNALELADQDKDIDIVRFYAYHVYPYLKPFKHGFSEMLYKFWFTDTNKIYHYSDHPHLRRNTFFEKFGRYAEGIKSDKGEYKMCISFIRNKGKGLFYNDYKGLFDQVNSAAEPSTVKREEWRLSSNLMITIIRSIYRQVKFNYDLHL